MPGPEVVVSASTPPQAAPIAAQMPPISSSAWKVVTSRCFSAASSWRISVAGVIG